MTKPLSSSSSRSRGLPAAPPGHSELPAAGPRHSELPAAAQGLRHSRKSSRSQQPHLELPARASPPRDKVQQVLRGGKAQHKGVSTTLQGWFAREFAGRFQGRVSSPHPLEIGDLPEPSPAPEPPSTPRLDPTTGAPHSHSPALPVCLSPVLLLSTPSQYSQSYPSPVPSAPSPVPVSQPGSSSTLNPPTQLSQSLSSLAPQ